MSAFASDPYQREIDSGMIIDAGVEGAKLLTTLPVSGLQPLVQTAVAALAVCV